MCLLYYFNGWCYTIICWHIIVGWCYCHVVNLHYVKQNEKPTHASNTLYVDPIDSSNSTDNCWMLEQIIVLTDTWMPDRSHTSTRCHKGTYRRMHGHANILEHTDIPMDIWMDIWTYKWIHGCTIMLTGKAIHTTILRTLHMCAQQDKMHLCLHLIVSDFPYLWLNAYS